MLEISIFLQIAEECSHTCVCWFIVHVCDVLCILWTLCSSSLFHFLHFWHRFHLPFVHIISVIPTPSHSKMNSFRFRVHSVSTILIARCPPHQLFNSGLVFPIFSTWLTLRLPCFWALPSYFSVSYLIRAPQGRFLPGRFQQFDVHLVGQDLALIIYVALLELLPISTHFIERRLQFFSWTSPISLRLQLWMLRRSSKGRNCTLKWTRQLKWKDRSQVSSNEQTLCPLPQRPQHQSQNPLHFTSLQTCHETLLFVHLQFLIH